jgi:hypothetical protein
MIQRENGFNVGEVGGSDVHGVYSAILKATEQ